MAGENMCVVVPLRPCGFPAGGSSPRKSAPAPEPNLCGLVRCEDKAMTDRAIRADHQRTDDWRTSGPSHRQHGTSDGTNLGLRGNSCLDYVHLDSSRTTTNGHDELRQRDEYNTFMNLRSRSRTLRGAGADK